MNIKSDVPTDVVFHHIVVPHDLTARSDRAVELAGTMAHPTRSEVVLINAIDPSEVDELGRDRQRFLEIAAKRLLPADMKFEVRILGGDAEDVILAEAKRIGADLMIVTVHPQTGADYPFRGSTVEHIMLRAPCPVVTVQVTEEEEIARIKQKMKLCETHSLKQYCDVSRQLSKTGMHRQVYMGYSHLPGSVSGAGG